METRRLQNQNLKSELNSELEPEPEPEPFPVTWKDVYPQLASDTVMSLTSICGGLSNSFLNLLDDVADREMKSWLASITTLLTIFGTLMVGPLVDKLGRKTTLLTIDVISILSWTMISMADKDRSCLLLIGVPLTGVVRGGIAAINVVFVTEITHKKYRSTMLSFTLVYLTFGILVAGLLGTLLAWKTVAILCAIFFTVVFVLAVYYTVESPIWLANFKADDDAAKRCLKKLTPNPQLFEREWMEMKKKGDDDNGVGGRRRPRRTDYENSSTTTTSMMEHLTRASFYRPAGVLLVLLALSQISGVNFMLYFVVDTVAEIGHDLGRANDKQIFLIVGTCKFALSLFTTALSTRFGRKTLLYASAGGTLASSVCVALCGAVYPGATYASRRALDYVAIFAYAVYMSFGCFGIWLVPYTLIGELLPNRLRGSCGPFFVCFSYAVMSAGAKIFPHLLQNLSVVHIFVFYALVSTLTLIFVLFYVPETRDKTLNEIENYFTAGALSRRNVAFALASSTDD